MTPMGIVRKGVRSAYFVEFAVGRMSDEILNVLIEGVLSEVVKFV